MTRNILLGFFDTLARYYFVVFCIRKARLSWHLNDAQYYDGFGFLLMARLGLMGFVCYNGSL